MAIAICDRGNNENQESLIFRQNSMEYVAIGQILVSPLVLQELEKFFAKSQLLIWSPWPYQVGWWQHLQLVSWQLNGEVEVITMVGANKDFSPGVSVGIQSVKSLQLTNIRYRLKISMVDQWNSQKPCRACGEASSLRRPSKPMWTFGRRRGGPRNMGTQASSGGYQDMEVS